MRKYTAIVERGPDTSLFVGYVPGFAGAHSQGGSLDELNQNLAEVVAMLLEDGEPKLDTEFVGTQTISAQVGRLPVPRPREVISLLQKLGFEEVRQRGFHKQSRHQTAEGRWPRSMGAATSRLPPAPDHKDIGSTRDEFLGHG